MKGSFQMHLNGIIYCRERVIKFSSSVAVLSGGKREGGLIKSSLLCNLVNNSLLAAFEAKTRPLLQAGSDLIVSREGINAAGSLESLRLISIRANICRTNLIPLGN